MSKNDITGDSLRSRPLSPECKANWDRIFAPKEKCLYCGGNNDKESPCTYQGKPGCLREKETYHVT